MRIIIETDEGEEMLALRAARALIRDGYQDCVYGYENGVHIYAKRTKTGVSARQSRSTWPACPPPSDRLSSRGEGLGFATG